MNQTSADIIRRVYEDFAKGEIPAVLDAFDPSIHWHVPGHSPLSGDYHGHGEVVEFFLHISALCGGIFAIGVDHVLAEGDVVAVLATITTERNGQRAVFPEVHVWRLERGKVTAFREYQGDEQAEDRFWSLDAMSS